MRSFNSKELSLAIRIQTVLFDPRVSASRATNNISSFLSQTTIPKEIVLASMLSTVVETQVYKTCDVANIIKNLVSEGLLKFDDLFSDRALMNEMEKLVQIDTSEGMPQLFTETNFRNHCQEIGRAVCNDDVELLKELMNQNAMDNTVYYIREQRFVGIVELCTQFRAIECLKELLRTNHKIGSRTLRIAAAVCSKTELISIFDVQEKQLTNLIPEATKARQLWLINEWKASPIYWEMINKFNILVQASPNDPWAPENYAPFVRPALGEVFDQRKWDSLTDLADKAYSGIALGSSDPISIFIEARAAEHRPKYFDVLVDDIFTHLENFEYLPELLVTNRSVSFSLFAKGLKPPIGVDLKAYGSAYLPFIPEVNELMEEKPFLVAVYLRDFGCFPVEEIKARGFEEVIQWAHPGFVPSLGFCLYNDDLTEMISALTHFNEELFVKKFYPVTILDLCASYGSQRCFLYLLENGYGITLSTMEHSIIGGCRPIEERTLNPNNESDWERLTKVCLSYRRLDEFYWISEIANNSIKPIEIHLLMPSLLPIPLLLQNATLVRCRYSPLLFPGVLRKDFFKLIDSLMRKDAQGYFYDTKTPLQIFQEM